MKFLEIAASLALWGCLSSAVVLALTLIADLLTPADAAVGWRERERRDAMFVGALTGMGFYLARCL